MKSLSSVCAKGPKISLFGTGQTPSIRCFSSQRPIKHVLTMSSLQVCICFFYLYGWKRWNKLITWSSPGFDHLWHHEIQSTIPTTARQLISKLRNDSDYACIHRPKTSIEYWKVHRRWRKIRRTLQPKWPTRRSTCFSRNRRCAHVSRSRLAWRRWEDMQFTTPWTRMQPWETKNLSKMSPESFRDTAPSSWLAYLVANRYKQKACCVTRLSWTVDRLSCSTHACEKKKETKIKKKTLSIVSAYIIFV